MGTAEAQIVREGRERILVQVPGLQDTAGLKELIGKTARLTFHEVHPTISASEARQTRVPSGYRIYEGGAREEGPSFCAKPRSCAAMSWSMRNRPSTAAPTNR